MKCVQEEVDFTTEDAIAGAEEAWRTVTRLLQSGVPLEGIAFIAQSTLQGLAELRTKLKLPRG